MYRLPHFCDAAHACSLTGDGGSCPPYSPVVPASPVRFSDADFLFLPSLIRTFLGEFDGLAASRCFCRCTDFAFLSYSLSTSTPFCSFAPFPVDGFATPSSYFVYVWLLTR